MSERVTSISFDSHLAALADTERRRLLLALLEAERAGTLPVGIDRPGRETGGTDHRLSMHHVHLPKLDELGFVDAGPDRDAVTTGPRFDEIRPLLELLDGNREQLPDDWL